MELTWLTVLVLRFTMKKSFDRLESLLTGKALTTVGGGTSVAWNLYISSNIDFYCLTQFPAFSILLIFHSCVPSQCSHLIISSSHQQQHLSLDREGRWGTTTSSLHFSLFSTAVWDLANSRPVNSLMLSSHLFLCVCLVFFPLSLCLAIWFWPSPDERETWPYHCSLRLFTMVRRSPGGPIACWILAQTSSLVAWFLSEMQMQWRGF